MAIFETGHRTNFLTYQYHNFLLNLSRVTFIPGLDSHKPNRNFTFDLIISPNNNGLCNLRMQHDRLLHFPSRQSMPRSIDDIIDSRHDWKISITVNHPAISCVVISFECCEVLVDVQLVVVQDWLHEWWWQGLFYAYYPRLVWGTFMACFLVKNSHIKSRDRLCCWTWFGLEFLVKSTEVGQDRTACLSLPICIVNELIRELLKQPLKCGNVTSLSNTSDSFKTGQIMLLDELPMRILLANRPDRSWWSIKMIN